MKQDIIYFIGFGFFNYHYPEEPKGFLPGLKIGYTSNLERRKLNYQNNLLDYEVISTRPGNEALEQAIHLWYSDYKLKIRRLVEWFRDYDYIRETFNIIPDEVFLRYSENFSNPRELNNLYNFGLRYLLKFPSDSFQQDQLWRAILGSGLNISEKSEINEKLIKELYDFSKRYLLVDLNNINEVLESLDEYLLEFCLLTDIDIKEDLEVYSKAKAILLKTVFEDRIKLCCKYFDEDPNHPVFNYLPEDYLRYFKEVGVSGITSVSYSHSKLEKMIKNNTEVKNSRNLFLNEFRITYKPGDRISLRELKEFFRSIRDKYKLSFSPKANLIKEYCSVVDTMITDKVTKKRLQAFKIISINDK